MANLSLYTDRGIRSVVAKKELDDMKIVYEEISTDTDPSAIEFLNSQDRHLTKVGLPQYFVGDVLAFEGGYAEVHNLSADEINQRVEEINASN